jgi:molybdopterin-guanine dinucleotide biosynthesis protein A
MAGAAGIVLAGGASRRMGEPKAGLDWHGTSLLRRTTGVLARAVEGPVLVVRAPGMPLPPLPATVQVVDDPVAGRGPLQGMAVGLEAAAQARAPTAFVCSTDLPFLHAAFVRRVLRALDARTDAVVPVAGGHRQPLAAAYRTCLAPACRELLAADRLRPAFLLEQCRTTWLDETALLADAELAAADPALDSVLNLNAPADYAAALARPQPEVSVQALGALVPSGQRGARTVRAATLGAAAAAVGVELDRHVIAAVNGDQLDRRPDSPLLAGDSVVLMSASAGG